MPRFQVLAVFALPLASWATELSSIKTTCDPLGFEHARGPRDRCMEEHFASVDRTARVYLPSPGSGFLANDYAAALAAEEASAPLEFQRVALRAVSLPAMADGLASGGFWSEVDMMSLAVAVFLALAVAGVATGVQQRKIRKKYDPFLRRYSKRDDPSARSAFSQAFTKRFWISAARSPFAWASRLFHKPNSAQPLSGLRRKSSQ